MVTYPQGLLGARANGPNCQEPGVTRRPLRTAAILLALIAAISTLTRMIPPEWQVVEGTPVVEAILDDRGTPAFGAQKADVIIVAFSDYQCAPCKAGEHAFERVISADGHVRVLYKDWPTLGKVSRAAARVALAADRQGKYLAVHEALMRSHVRLDAGNLRAIATGEGVDWPRLQADLIRDGDAIDTLLTRQSFQAWSLGLQGTPAYLVGPYLLRGRLSERDLKDAITAARRHLARSEKGLAVDSTAT